MVTYWSCCLQWLCLGMFSTAKHPPAADDSRSVQRDDIPSFFAGHLAAVSERHLLPEHERHRLAGADTRKAQAGGGGGAQRQRDALSLRV